MKKEEGGEKRKINREGRVESADTQGVKECCAGRVEKLIVRGSLFTAADPERDREGERERAQRDRKRQTNKKQRCKR